MIRKFACYLLVCLLVAGLASPVLAYDANIDKELRAIWSGLKSALAKHDTDKALSYIAVANRQHYKEVYTALGRHLPEVARGMGDIQLITMEKTLAKYRQLSKKVNPGKQEDVTHYVYFIVDKDGVWRVFRY